MARKKKLFRIETLTSEEQRELQQAFQGVETSKGLDYLEETGKLSPEALAQGAGNLLGVQRILAKLPTKKVGIEQYLGKQKGVDPALLTEEELQDKLEALQGISPTETKTPRKEQLKSIILNSLNELYPDVIALGNNADDAASRITDLVLKGEPIKDAAKTVFDTFSSEWRETNDRQKQEFGRIVSGKPLQDLINKKLTQPIDYYKGEDVTPFTGVNPYAEDIKIAQGLLSTKGAKREKDQTIEDYLSGLQGQLAGSTEQFLKSEEERAYGELERQVPLVLQNLNARGMLFSGEVEDALTTRALSLGSSLEAIQADLEAEDSQFYYDAAYRNALKKELQSVDDYKSAISTQRGRVLTERSQKFRSTQEELDRELDEELKKSDYTRDLALRRKGLERQRTSAEQARRGQLIGNIAEAGTRIVGGVAADKVSESVDIG